ncbi:PhoX family protein [Halorarum salinum]|uniref:DUF839 domain-containing protein n=1 Tax=Halorarum salinum TaxID=2743089 RepID=A0A7D5QBZ9_9EURY|nr:alkaline phosphatase PhoX [Halobaculum salinum]QLG61241.1 DUF839 domain-containing protein [Halobaculum salinum]
MFDVTRRGTLELFALAAGADPTALSGTREGGEEGSDGDGTAEAGPTLTRLATTVPGSEITGLCVSPAGDLFFNVQNPEADNPEPFDHGGVGAVEGASLADLPSDAPSVPLPEDGEGGEVRTAAGTYRMLASGGDPTDDGARLGVPYSPDGTELTDGNAPDFNGFVPSSDAADEGYLFTNWESRPGMVSRLHLRRAAGGSWEVLGGTNVDFRSVEGTWGNCFGSVSPWGTPLSAEENFSAALTPRWNDPDWDRGDDEDGDEVANLAAYLGYHPNPYRYGYVVEITGPESAEPTPTKRFAMGRFAHETAAVMPDERTAYLTDDGSAKSFYKFVADEPGDLSSGTLYAAKHTQDEGEEVATVGFDVEWIELAHGDEAEIEGWIAEYDGIGYDEYEDDETSYVTGAEVEAWANGEADDDRVAFLETMRAAEAVGATTEFRKMEGINAAPGAEPGDSLYVSMSKVDATMADGEGDVRLAGNEYGAVYRLPLESNYDVSRLEPVLTGGPEANVCGGCPYDASPNADSSVCADCALNPRREEDDGKVGFRGTSLLGNAPTVDPENAIANPDNLVVLPDGRVVVGEDTSEHEHNMIWLYDPGEGDGSGTRTS